MAWTGQGRDTIIWNDTLIATKRIEAPSIIYNGSEISNTYVPYTGANANVDLGSNNLNAYILYSNALIEPTTSIDGIVLNCNYVVDMDGTGMIATGNFRLTWEQQGGVVGPGGSATTHYALYPSSAIDADLGNSGGNKFRDLWLSGDANVGGALDCGNATFTLTGDGATRFYVNGYTNPIDLTGQTLITDILFYSAFDGAPNAGALLVYKGTNYITQHDENFGSAGTPLTAGANPDIHGLVSTTTWLGDYYSTLTGMGFNTIEEIGSDSETTSNSGTIEVDKNTKFYIYGSRNVAQCQKTLDIGTIGKTFTTNVVGGQFKAKTSGRSPTLTGAGTHIVDYIGGDFIGEGHVNINNSIGGRFTASTSLTNKGIEVSAITTAQTLNVGLDIENISGATTNYAIRTGTGQNELGDDLYFVNSGSGLPYGSFYGNEFNQSQVMAQNTEYQVAHASIADATTANLVTSDGNGKFTIVKAGRYNIQWAITAEHSVTGKHILWGVAVDQALRGEGQMHRETKTANAEYQVAGNTIINMAVGEDIEIGFKSAEATPGTAEVSHMNLSVMQIGG